jgi:hypothetical protein
VPSTFPLKERRCWPRRPRQFRIFLADPRDEESTPIPVRMVNLSPGGLRLSFPDAVEDGTILKVRPVAAPARLGWIAVQVRNGRATPQGWEAGCQFIESPSLATLLLFG